MRVKRILLAGALGLGAVLAVPLAAAPASAATPGTYCEIHIDRPAYQTFEGTVTSNGLSCKPDVGFADDFSVLNLGAPCGTTVPVVITGIPGLSQTYTTHVRITCPY